MIELKEILAKSTPRFTSAVLTDTSAKGFTFSENETSKHFGLFDDDLIGIISLFENKNPLFQDTVQIQIRGLSILEDYQKYHLSEKLIRNCEKTLLPKNDLVIWFNARKTGVASYEKLGYKTIGDVFEIEGVGKHIVMFKKLGV